MIQVNGKGAAALILVALVGLQGCGDDSPQPEQAAAPSGGEAAGVAVDDAELPGDTVSGNPEPTSESAAEQPDEGDMETIDPDELEPAGQIELKQYTVAWVGSGTMGGGTLIVDGKEYPFRLAGLGVGGYGASAIDASGVVYNLPNLDAFPGTYGNARLGMTGGDAGGGKLWLRNANGVVIELESEMRGLALTGGVDGILIQWEDKKDSGVDKAMDTTRDAAGKAIDAGADAVQGGVDSVKGWLDKDD